MYWFLFLLGLALLSFAFVVWSLRRRRLHIPLLLKQRLREAWEEAVEVKDPAKRVLEAEKVTDAVLKALGCSGTFAEKLQSMVPHLPGAKDIWNAHRLRNRIAHEMNVRISRDQSDRALQAFAQIVHRYLS
jgi:hypothetical protein